MNEPIKAGDHCEVVWGAEGAKSPNIGLRVVVLAAQGEHSFYGPIWLCEGDAVRYMDGRRNVPARPGALRAVVAEEAAEGADAGQGCREGGYVTKRLLNLAAVIAATSGLDPNIFGSALRANPNKVKQITAADRQRINDAEAKRQRKMKRGRP